MTGRGAGWNSDVMRREAVPAATQRRTGRMIEKHGDRNDAPLLFPSYPDTGAALCRGRDRSWRFMPESFVTGGRNA